MPLLSEVNPELHSSLVRYARASLVHSSYRNFGPNGAEMWFFEGNFPQAEFEDIVRKYPSHTSHAREDVLSELNQAIAEFKSLWGDGIRPALDYNGEITIYETSGASRDLKITNKGGHIDFEMEDLQRAVPERIFNAKFANSAVSTSPATEPAPPPPLPEEKPDVSQQAKPEKRISGWRQQKRDKKAAQAEAQNANTSEPELVEAAPVEAAEIPAGEAAPPPASEVPPPAAKAPSKSAGVGKNIARATGGAIKGGVTIAAAYALLGMTDEENYVEKKAQEAGDFAKNAKKDPLAAAADAGNALVIEPVKEIANLGMGTGGAIIDAYAQMGAYATDALHLTKNAHDEYMKSDTHKEVEGAKAQSSLITGGQERLNSAVDSVAQGTVGSDLVKRGSNIAQNVIYVHDVVVSPQTQPQAAPDKSPDAQAQPVVEIEGEKYPVSEQLKKDYDLIDKALGDAPNKSKEQEALAKKAVSVEGKIVAGDLDGAAKEARKAATEIESEKVKNNGFKVVDNKAHGKSAHHERKVAHHAPSGDAFTRKIEKLVKDSRIKIDGVLSEDERKIVEKALAGADAKITTNDKGAITDMNGWALVGVAALKGHGAVSVDFSKNTFDDNINSSLPSKPRNNSKSTSH